MAVKEYRFNEDVSLQLTDGDFVRVFLGGEKINFNLICEKDANATLYVQMKELRFLNLNTKILSSAKCNILFWNNCEEETEIKEEYHVEADAELLVSYGELSSGSVKRNSMIHLDGKGASADLSSATVCGCKKTSYIEIAHHQSNTRGEMEHYGIILKDGRFKMEAVGKIDRGAASSKSHQTTRILTFDKKQNATVLPKLLIDENDVEASHATSLGQPDENQLYYMQSRGLTRQMAMELITLGYLLPIASKISDEELRTILKEQIESKVKELWLM